MMNQVSFVNFRKSTFAATTIRNSFRSLVRFSYSMQTEFLCICRDTKSNDMVLQCSKCLFWQHAKCVAKYSNQPILNYICPKCWKLEEPVHSMTTFIACPSSIKGQWNNEIRRHISSPNFKVSRRINLNCVSVTDVSHVSVVSFH